MIVWRIAHPSTAVLLFLLIGGDTLNVALALQKDILIELSESPIYHDVAELTASLS